MPWEPTAMHPCGTVHRHLSARAFSHIAGQIHQALMLPSIQEIPCLCFAFQPVQEPVHLNWHCRARPYQQWRIQCYSRVCPPALLAGRGPLLSARKPRLSTTPMWVASAAVMVPLRYRYREEPLHTRMHGVQHLSSHPPQQSGFRQVYISSLRRMYPVVLLKPW